MIQPTTIKIDEVEYVRRDSLAETESVKSTDGLEYVIVRGDRSGVFAGFLKSQKGKDVEMVNARRLWYWSGAASISQLAVDGTKKPTECKFPCEVATLILTDAIEIIPATAKAKKTIDSVTVWQQ